MSKLGNAKILGGIGAILTLIGSFFGVLTIVGLIMLFIAVKYVAEEAKEDSIFRNYLMYFIFSLVAVIAAVSLIVVSIGGNILNFTKFFQEMAEEASHGATEGIMKFLAGIIVALIVAWILMILASIYLRKSYNRIAEYSKVDLFRTTGMLYFIGAITLIIFIGFIGVVD
ncbi:MAG: DUF996 domain-containing protein [Thermoplasmatales archaeon]|nr:DUF996 domain-containing protein [Thermoplasmatales archaeon]